MITAIIPIILTVGLGFLVECRRTMDVRAISSISIYILLPCLIFHSLLTTELTLEEALPVIAILFLSTLALWLLAKSYCRLRRLPRQDESVFLLTSVFMNAGNMGMPVALYAFGDRGLELAVLWVLGLNVLMNTVAVYYASRHRGGARQAIRTVFSLPSIYAAAAALAMRGLHLTIPEFLMPALYLLGRSLIPVAQLLLGMELAKACSQVGSHLPAVIAPTLVRLVVGPAITFALISLLGIGALTAKVALLLAAMPTAVNVSVYSTEFGLQPRRVATAVFTSTLASFVTLSVLLILLG
jgi:predicted permease